jgi:hypothetical protein
MSTDQVPAQARLTPDDVALLEFERDWTGTRAAKDEAIATVLGLSPARYQQRLLALIGLPEAVRYDPLLVSRLTRLESARAAERRARASAIASGAARGAAHR